MSSSPFSMTERIRARLRARSSRPRFVSRTWSISSWISPRPITSSKIVSPAAAPRSAAASLSVGAPRTT